MRTFQKGEKSKLSDLTPSVDLTVAVSLSGSGSDTFDVSLFGVDAAGQLSDDRYMIFYNQRTSPEGALAAKGPSGADTEVFQVNLAGLPPSIKKMVFTATVDGAGSMSSVRAGHLRISAGSNEVARYAFTGADFTTEKALILGEVYFKDVWRFSAVGQGFSGGLPALLKHFGGEEASSSPAPPPPRTASPPPPPPAPPAPPKPPPISLSKITLEKKGDQRTVNLRKGGGAQPIHFNLNWNQGGGQKRGFLASMRASNAPDLDLGCMYELTTGEMGVIQPLGKKFGSREAPPFIHLDKDDRTGAAADGENLYFMRPELIRRAMVFAMIYEGAGDFTSVGGHMTIKDQEGNETLVELNNPDANRTFCSICTLTSTGSAVTITKEERYFRGHQDADGYYQFGFRWSAGSK